MEFCGIDFAFNDNRVSNVALASSRTLLDFDVVLIDAGRLQPVDPGHYHRRNSEIKELLALGRSVFWFVRPGSIHHLLPIEATSAISFSGTKVEFVGRDIYRDFWKAIEPLLQYEAYLEGAYGDPFLKVLNSQKPIGSTIERDSGLIMLLPAPKVTRTLDAHNALWRDVLDCISPLLQRLRPTKGLVAFPGWSLQHTWRAEEKIRLSLAKLRKIATETAQAITTTSNALVREEQLRRLFATSGDPLVDAVIEAFNELGAKAQRGEPGRADVLVEHDGLNAVIEVKGRKGSAAEKDAAQLEKWVAMSKEERDIDAKGVLIVNAFCETPLSQRTEAAFPNQMLKYSKQREHCLMTSTQLLGMVLMSRGKAQSGHKYLDKMFSTSGIFEEVSDYTIFLEQTGLASKAETS